MNIASQFSLFKCDVAVTVIGINEAKFNDGYFLPHTQGFQYVGTIIPFTLAWNCDTSKVKYKLTKHSGIILAFVIFRNFVFVGVS